MVTLRKLFLFIFIVEIVFMVLLIFLLQTNLRLERQLKTAVTNKTVLEDKAEELRLSSDDLTRFARMYIVTGNPEYKKNFYKVQDIRNGLVPRPVNYGNIYWDYFEPERSARHPDGEPQSIIETFRELPLTDAERAKLEEAYQNSEGLIDIEKEAFHAAEGLFKDEQGNYTIEKAPDRQYAISLVFYDTYMEAKQKIMRPIDEFMEMLRGRTADKINQLNRMNERNNMIIRIVDVVFFAVNLLIFIVLHIRIVKVISDMIMAIRNSKKDNTDLTLTIPNFSRLDELGELITEFNKMSSTITKRSNMLEKSNSRLVDQYNMIDNYIILSESTPEGIMTQVSTAFCRVSGYSRSELIGRKHDMLVYTKDPSSPPVELFSLLPGCGRWQGEIQSIKKNGESYWLEVHVEPETDSSNNFTGILVIGNDITARKQLRKLSITDPLTDLYNRNRLNEILPDLVYTAERYSLPLSVIMIDIDKFKNVNDSYGHQKGDLVLKGFSGIFKNKIRRSDTAGRWGGEEFLITCPETGIDDAAKLAEKLRGLCADLKIPDMPPQTASFGVTEFRADDTIDELISRADTALYKAKDQGRNRVVII